MRHSLTYTSESDDRKWEHIRLETPNELEALKKMLGRHCTMEVTKGRPGKVDNYKVLLNENDTTNIVIPINDKPEFRRRNVTTHGIDLMHSEGACGKVWARCKSQKANETPFLIAALESMRNMPPALDVDLENDEDDET